MSKLTGVILLEGPDGAGKTTLAKALCDRYDGRYVHRTWHKGMDVWEHHTEAIKIAFDNSHERLVVIDRLWPSESIYGATYRDGSEYGYNARAMDRVMLRMATLNVLCIPRDTDYIEKIHGARAAEGGEMYSTVGEVARRYVQWMDGLNDEEPTTSYDYRNLLGDVVEQQTGLGGFRQQRRDWFHYDVTSAQGAHLNQTCENIAHLLVERQRQQWPAALNPATPNILGHKEDAIFLFVGEKLGDLHNWSRWPFYARTHSPEYLNKTLHKVMFPEQLGAWTNAWDEDNQLPKIYEQSPGLKVICLGKSAEKRAKAFKIPIHATVHHPSYARRFNHHGNYGTPYGEQFRKAFLS